MNIFPETMRYRTIIAGGLLVALVVGAVYLPQLLRPKRTYEARGRVAGFGSEPRIVLVAHEDIPALMPAMTMPLKARSREAIEGLQVGDAIRFTLAVNPDSAWIYDVEELPGDTAPGDPAGEPATRRPASPGAPMLAEGAPVPPFRLTGQGGAPVRLSGYRGQALLVTFIYTRCPLPDYCPLMSERFAALQPKLKKRFGQEAQLLSISFDPEYDTLEVLRSYARRYEADLDTWTFATGTPEQVRRVTSMFGVLTSASGRQIIHNLTTVLIGPEGRLAKVWRGNDWTPSEVIRTVGRVLKNRAAPPAH